MSSTRGWLFRRPLQIESLRQDLPQSRESEEQLRRLQHLRENLDAVIYALSSRTLAADRRIHLLEILHRHQQSLDECLDELGLRPQRHASDPLWHYHQLEPLAQAHLAAILGVPEEQPFYEVLDIKAQEYLYQQRAFEEVAQRFSFRMRQQLPRSNSRAALVLTLSGSLIQLSEPIGPKGARRYLYQNIYGNAHPPEGVLVLDRDLEAGHRLRSVELTTSPVRLLCEVSRKLSWKAQAASFEHISRTLSSLGSRSASQLAAAGFQPIPKTSEKRVANLSAAERVFAQEYGEAQEHFFALRQRFLSDPETEPRRVEAELLTLCHYLQTGARELGFDTYPFEQVAEFITDEEHLYQVDASRAGSVILRPRGRGPQVQFIDISLGRQLLTRGAPLAFIGKGGGVVEVTLPIRTLRCR